MFKLLNVLGCIRLSCDRRWRRWSCYSCMCCWYRCKSSSNREKPPWWRLFKQRLRALKSIYKMCECRLTSKRSIWIWYLSRRCKSRLSFHYATHAQNSSSNFRKRFCWTFSKITWCRCTSGTRKVHWTKHNQRERERNLVLKGLHCYWWKT